MAARKKRKKVSATRDPLAGLVIEQQRKHAEFVTQTTDEGGVRAYNITECNLDVYHSRGYITDEQHYAGVKLYNDFYRSQLVKGYRSALNVVEGSRSTKPSDPLNLEAYHAYLKALKSVTGKKMQQVMVAVCCMGEWLKYVTVPLRRNEHSKMAAFRRALDELVKHYGIASPYQKKDAKISVGIVTTLG